MLPSLAVKYHMMPAAMAEKVARHHLIDGLWIIDLMSKGLMRVPMVRVMKPLNPRSASVFRRNSRRRMKRINSRHRSQL